MAIQLKFFVVNNRHLSNSRGENTPLERISEDLIFELNQVLLAILYTEILTSRQHCNYQGYRR